MPDFHAMGKGRAGFICDHINYTMQENKIDLDVLYNEFSLYLSPLER